MQNISLRKVEKNEINILLELLKELAIFEEMLDDVKCDEKLLYESIFIKNYVNALFILIDDKIVGYAMYFYTFSSFLGRGGLYLEDLYVKPEFRNQGCGKKVFEYLINIAKEQNLGRIEWVCLRGNQKAIDFYEKKIGAKDMSEIWHLYRITDEKFKTLELN